MEGEIVTSQNTAVHTDHGVSINPGPCAWGVHGRNSYREFVSFPESIEDIPTRRNLRSMSGFGCVNAGHNAVFEYYILYAEYAGRRSVRRDPPSRARGRFRSARPRPVWDLARKFDRLPYGSLLFMYSDLT